MKRALFSITICLSLFLSQLVSANQAPSETVLKNSSPALEKANAEAQVRLSKTYGKLPLQFEANAGQTDGQVKFLTRGSGYSMFFTPTESVLVLSKRDEKRRQETADRKSLDPVILSLSKGEDDSGEGKIITTAIRMRLEGANPAPRMFGEELLPGKSNYLIGNDPKKWRTNVSNYKKVRYDEVYPGIDLVYYGNQRKLEYDFVVKPGADPSVIQLSFDGIESYSIENGGDLVLHTTQGDVTQKKPVIYQEIEGQPVDVAGNYIFLDDEKVAFHLGDYDNTQPLVIDPVLVYSTFLGSSGADLGRGIAVDGSGNAYVAGFTNSTDFPTSAGAFDTSFNGNTDIFVTKLNASGTGLIYSTFLGGSGQDGLGGIAVDGSGSTYVTGSTFSTDFPTTTGALQTSSVGSNNTAFVAKLNPSGTSLDYATYLGEIGQDSGCGIAVDGSGNAFIMGTTNSADFPTTVGAYDTTLNIGGNFIQDIFVTKLNASGTSLLYSTFLGGGDGETIDFGGIVVDGSGNAYVTGTTQSTDFPTTAGAFQTSFQIDGSNPTDVFVTKLNPSGTGLIYSTFLGGSRRDRSGSIVVDLSGSAYVTGATRSNDFPTTAGAFDTTSNVTSDAFVTKFNATGTGLIYSTFLGGDNEDELGRGIAVDISGNAYVAGFTESTDFPTTAGAFDTSFNGDVEIFVTKLNPEGTALIDSTFLGGSGEDILRGIALDGSGNVYLTGYTQSTDFPTIAGAFDTSFNGNSDIFVTKFGLSPRVPDVVGLPQVDATIAIINAGLIVGTVNLQSSAIVPEGEVLSQDPVGGTDAAPGSAVNIVVSSGPPPIADAGVDQVVEQEGPTGSNVILNGSGSSNSLTFAWTGPFGSATGEFPTVLIPEGTHIVTLVVNNGTADSPPDTVSITVQDTIDPVVTPPADLTVTATGTLTPVAIGTATATDAVGVVSLTDDAPALGFPVGTTVITWTATDAAGNEGTAVQNVTVENNTSTGTGVPVDPVDPATGDPTRVSLMFDNVTTEGATTADVTSGGPPPPTGFQLGDPPTYIELETTATFSGLVEVCLDYSGVSFADENNLKLLHFVSPDWVDITTSKDTVNKIICGNTPSFSFFALFEPELPIDVVVQESEVKFDLEDANRDSFEVRGTYSLSLDTDGIDVLNEDVIVKFGDFSQTIPAGSFVSEDDGEEFSFEGSTGKITQMEIEAEGKFEIKAEELNLQGIDFQKPVLFSIQIGNDFGEKQIQFLDLRPNEKKFKLLDDDEDDDDEEDDDDDEEDDD